MKPIRCERGFEHEFLGMRLDFGRDPGKVHIIQEEHQEDLVKHFPEQVKGNSPSPAAQDLFKRGAGGLLDNKRRKIFHTCVTKGLSYRSGRDQIFRW